MNVQTYAPVIRALDRYEDFAAVLALYERAADYIVMETGRPPNDGMVERFFHDGPPGFDSEDSLKLGLFERPGELSGIADLAFGFPGPGDAYIGLLLFAPECRGRGLGRAFIERLVEEARAKGAQRILAGVLDQNRAGQSFWLREGFRTVRTMPATVRGRKTHVVHRMERLL